MARREAMVVRLPRAIRPQLVGGAISATLPGPQQARASAAGEVLRSANPI